MRIASGGSRAALSLGQPDQNVIRRYPAGAAGSTRVAQTTRSMTMFGLFEGLFAGIFQWIVGLAVLYYSVTSVFTL